MAANDFLVFGGGAGSNVISQGAWAALAARTAGFSSGVAQSAQLNKAWRQSSIMAAVLAQFVADITAQDVIDDGTVANILSNLKAAVRAQSNGVVGSARNLRIVVSTSGSTATVTADEIVLEDALGGKVYRIAGFNRAVDLSTTGLGGMDTGAPPANGYVALYAVLNPTTGAFGLIAKNATSSVQSEVYTGGNPVAGYTASALVSVAPTVSGGNFGIFSQVDRLIDKVPAVVISTSSGSGSNPVSFSIAVGAPPNAKWVSGAVSVTPTSGQAAGSAQMGLTIYSNASGANGVGASSIGSIVGGGLGGQGNFDASVYAAQTLYYTNTISTGSGTFSATISRYRF